MPRFLISDENPAGYKLEDILAIIRADVITKSAKIASDDRPEAQHVLANSVQVLSLLTQAIDLARDSTKTLDRAFGPAGETPRIGQAS